MEDIIVCQGRALTPAQREELRGWIAAHLDWSRKRLAREPCRRWDWRNERGRLKDFAARSLLLKLAARGRVALPPLCEQFRRVRRAPTRPREVAETSPPVLGPLAMLQPIGLEVITPGTATARRWAWYLAAHHYLGWHVIGDWQAKCRHGLEGLETFVESPPFAGTCYRAAN